ncbi:SH3 and PX domain-containing protein 2A-like isoform X2 [Haliotis asinina]
MEPSQRIIPILPGKILFGRSHIREVALKRLKPIDEYCQLLIDLPEQISQCEDVLSFFEVEGEDLEPPKTEENDQRVLSKVSKISKPKQLQQYVAVADYTKQETGEIDLHTGMVMEVLEQSESGWWFVSTENQQGWVPSTFLQSNGGVRKDSTTRAKPGEEWKYICIEPFQTEREDELCLDRGSVVEVMEKNLVGWWFVRHQSLEGWVPATYLCKLKNYDQVGEVEVKGTSSDINKSLQNEGRSLANYWKDGDAAEETSLSPSQGIFSKVKNTRSSEKGGSLRPPPRQDSFEAKTIMVCDVNIQEKPANYITVADFQDSVGDGISFSAGRIVTVHEKAEGGWWYVEIDGHSGWAPSSYIESSSVKNGSDSDDSPRSNECFVHSSSSKISEIVTEKCDNICFGKKKPIPPPESQTCHKPPLLPIPTSKSSNVLYPKQSEEGIIKKMFLPGARHLTENVKTPEPAKAMIQPQLKVKSTMFDGEEEDDITSKQAHAHSTTTLVKRKMDKVTEEAAHKESAASRFGKKPPITGVQKPQLRPKPTGFTCHYSSKAIKPADSLESKHNVSQVVMSPSVCHTEEVTEVRLPELKAIHKSYMVSSIINAFDGKLVFGGTPAIPRPGILTEKNKCTPKDDVKDGSGPVPNPLPAELESTDDWSLAKSTHTLFKTVSIFTAENEGELGFDEGEVVDVVEKGDGGWWLIKISGRGKGWAPAKYIKEY